jgi:hypothetical protein
MIQGDWGPVTVYLEQGRRYVLACAVDWPGWCSYGTSEQKALEALISCAPRYALIARTADIPFPEIPFPEIPHRDIRNPGCDISMFQVAERLAGSASADHGAPGLVPACDALPVDAPTAQRSATLLTAAWAVFYQVSGGQSTSRLVDHVIDADVASARKLGIRRRRPSSRDTAGIVSLREGITAVVGKPSDGSPAITRGWTTRYAARQIAWHVIDHIWQIEDSGPPARRSGNSFQGQHTSA